MNSRCKVGKGTTRTAGGSDTKFGAEWRIGAPKSARWGSSLVKRWRQALFLRNLPSQSNSVRKRAQFAKISPPKAAPLAQIGASHVRIAPLDGQNPCAPRPKGTKVPRHAMSGASAVLPQPRSIGASVLRDPWLSCIRSFDRKLWINAAATKTHAE